MLNTSILFIIFNRPDTTRRVFEAIRIAKPTKLFISADGPRSDKTGENNKCNEVRDIVNDLNIDWPCEVHRNYSAVNLGCKKAVAGAINWFFENVDEGIILEDDCLPDQSFFDFTSKMLDKYRENENIMEVRGTNLQFGKTFGDGDYYFSKSPHIWGWATWKRAWKKYDIEMSDLETFIDSKRIYKIFKDRKIANFWISIFKHVKYKNIDTWDTQWAYTIIKSEGVSIVPNINLIENIGIRKDATHTTEGPSFLTQKSSSLPITIKHPSSMEISTDADIREMHLLYITPWYKWPNRIFKKIIRCLKI